MGQWIDRYNKKQAENKQNAIKMNNWINMLKSVIFFLLFLLVPIMIAIQYQQYNKFDEQSKDLTHQLTEMKKLNDALEHKIQGKNKKYIELLDKYTIQVNELQTCENKMQELIQQNDK